MDPITQQTLAVAGSGPSGPSKYVDDLFSITTWEGDGTSNRAVNSGLDNTDGKNMVWVKAQSSTYDHVVTDTERANRATLWANENYAETSANLDSFTSTGFTTSSAFVVNRQGHRYVGWNFKAEPGFFDIVTYSGNGTAGRQVAHNLGSVPGMIIFKRRNGVGDWYVYHRSIGATGVLKLNSTNGTDTHVSYFNNTLPTSTHINFGSGQPNQVGEDYVAYVFAHDDQSFGDNGDESIIKCGTFFTNASGQAQINLGWEPQYILTKTTSSGHFGINDSIRSMPGGKTTQQAPYAQGLFATNNNAEGNWDVVSPTATGFNALGGFGNNAQVVYMAIRRPHKPASAGTDVFSASSRTGTASQIRFNTAFSPDLLITKNYAQNSYQIVARDRHTHPTNLLQTHQAAAEFQSTNGVTHLHRDSIEFGADSNGSLSNTSNQNGQDYINWIFKRSPGFFDLVAYEGTGANRSLAHNLGVTPELIIVKNRDYTYDWFVYTASLGSAYYLTFATTNAGQQDANIWTNQPTADVFYTGGSISTGTNRSGDRYIAYLFASQAGVSKVGSYTGLGSNYTHDMHCGFGATSARFVLIKRTDSSGDWYVYDSTRGITFGNDPYLLLNSSNAQVTGTNYINPLNGGFTVNGGISTPLNVLNASYTYLAIV